MSEQKPVVLMEGSYDDVSVWGVVMGLGEEDVKGAVQALKAEVQAAVGSRPPVPEVDGNATPEERTRIGMAYAAAASASRERALAKYAEIAALAGNSEVHTWGESFKLAVVARLRGLGATVYYEGEFGSVHAEW